MYINDLRCMFKINYKENLKIILLRINFNSRDRIMFHIKYLNSNSHKLCY